MGIVEQQIVDEISGKETHGDSQLIERDHLATVARDGNLANINRCDNRQYTNTDSADNARRDKKSERRREGAAHSRGCEQHGGDEHRRAAPELVAHHAGNGNAEDAANERAAHIPSLHLDREMILSHHLVDSA